MCMCKQSSNWTLRYSNQPQIPVTLNDFVWSKHKKSFFTAFIHKTTEKYSKQHRHHHIDNPYNIKKIIQRRPQTKINAVVRKSFVLVPSIRRLYLYHRWSLAIAMEYYWSSSSSHGKTPAKVAGHRAAAGDASVSRRVAMPCHHRPQALLCRLTSEKSHSGGGARPPISLTKRCGGGGSPKPGKDTSRGRLKHITGILRAGRVWWG